MASLCAGPLHHPILVDIEIEEIVKLPSVLSAGEQRGEGGGGGGGGGGGNDQIISFQRDW